MGFNHFMKMIVIGLLIFIILASSFESLSAPFVLVFSIPLAAAALQFPLGNDIVTSVIPGPRNKGELQQIMGWAETPIPSEFWSALKARGLLNEDAPTPNGPVV